MCMLSIEKLQKHLNKALMAVIYHYTKHLCGPTRASIEISSGRVVQRSTNNFWLKACRQLQSFKLKLLLSEHRTHFSFSLLQKLHIFGLANDCVFHGSRESIPKRVRANRDQVFKYTITLMLRIIYKM